MTEDAYTKAGVNIDAGEQFAGMIKDRVATAWPDHADTIGGFAGRGTMPLHTDSLSASVDGTGTKIIIAALMNMFEGIGQDAVAMAMVDTWVDGCQPAYGLDILGVAKLDPDRLIPIIDSVIKGCQMAGAVLIGGETAELPDLFRYPWMVNLDMAAIGFPEDQPGQIKQEQARDRLKAGDKVYGWLSHGVASNGFSLVRSAFGLKTSPSKMRRKLERCWPELGGKMLAEALLEPTPIYINRITKQRDRCVIFNGHAHITGGGLPGNIPRILPDHLMVTIDRSTWPRPAIFPLVQGLGNVDERDMARTFNNGIMMVSIVDSGSKLPNDPEAVYIGQVDDRKHDEPQVQFIGNFQD